MFLHIINQFYLFNWCNFFFIYFNWNLKIDFIIFISNYYYKQIYSINFNSFANILSFYLLINYKYLYLIFFIQIINLVIYQIIKIYLILYSILIYFCLHNNSYFYYYFLYTWINIIYEISTYYNFILKTDFNKIYLLELKKVIFNIY